MARRITLGVGAVLLTACSGSSGSTTAASAPNSTTSTVAPVDKGEWRSARIDGPIVRFAELRGTAAMLVADDRDRLTVYLLSDAGWEPVTYNPIRVTDLRHIEWGPVVSDGERIVLTLTGRERDGPGGRGNRLLEFVTTTDGETFTSRSERGSRVTRMASDGDRWVAIGNQTEPGHRPTPAIWLSNDGVMWEQAVVEELGSDLWLRSVVAAEGRIVVVAQDRRLRALSTIDGIDWRIAPLENTPETWYLNHVDGRFEVSDGDGGLESVDGFAWTEFEATGGRDDASVWGDGAAPRFHELRIAAPATADGSLLTAGSTQHRTNLLYCYDDPATCRVDVLGLWIRTDLRWRRLLLDLPRPGPCQVNYSTFDPSGVIVQDIAFEAGAVILKTLTCGDDDGVPKLSVLTWHADAALPDEAPPLDPSPPGAAYAIPDHREPLTIGVEYAIPLSTLCSADALSFLGTFGGIVWRSDDIGGRVDPRWTTMPTTDRFVGGGVLVLGVAERVSEDLVEYRMAGVGLIATYRPGSADGIFTCG